ncbi:UDP-2,4-diacetamido-2,4,6-trideoxy-beta-L-altropyranose hydrolase [Caenimonas sedimenti]|uniref:UDP-2,4-diacetamido-2,4, 6-trideoxy-beta-L-altropyranose hydrolase n=1 Tax=Caenimonas sedimenti TaxID=2596921 RepID=UPI0016450DD2|nr:UDP-2,4-diacetamido-2,4,6-trideoxy-beta-L-altropyranose hydrolase [Caenimonas sedimenti]
MKVLVRADASLALGSGHVMRCRTLAAELQRRGHGVTFACRPLDGHLLELLRAGGFETAALPLDPHVTTGLEPIGDAQALADAQACVQLAGALDWVVVDHYGLGARWEQVLRNAGARVLALDDLADRLHSCDLLLDQNPGGAERYAARVPPGTRLLVGPEWALVRPEFPALRATSLERRQRPVLQRLLVFLGGGDVAADVQVALTGALASGIPWTHVDVVLGSGVPGADAVAAQLKSFPSAVLHVQTEHMARLMADADVAITAGGGVTWEKCCLGLPSLVAVLAENQGAVVPELRARGAAVVLEPAGPPRPEDIAAALRALTPASLAAMAQAAAGMCSGQGAPRVAAQLEQGTKDG